MTNGYQNPLVTQCQLMLYSVREIESTGLRAPWSTSHATSGLVNSSLPAPSTQLFEIESCDSFHEGQHLD